MTDAPARPGKVLVAVDFGEASIAAARWIADHFAPAAELVFAHVIEPPPATRGDVKRYPSMETIVSKVHVDAEARLREFCRSLEPARATVEIRVGSPHEELVGLATSIGADLLVVARQDLASSGWARIGATAQRILRRSPVPVLLVAAPRNRPPRQILVAVDESDMTEHVIRWGASLAKRYSAAATVLHASGPEAVEDDEAWLAQQVGGIPEAKGMGLLVERSEQRPAHVIIEQASDLDAELIVIGSRGAGAAEQMLFGSVAESVLLSSPCPVLVVVPGKRGVS